MGFFRRQLFNFFDYFKILANDYKAVAVDLVKDARERPIKTVGVLNCLAALYYAHKTNPSEKNFLSTLIERRQLMTILPNSMHSSTAENHLDDLSNFVLHNRLNHIDCVFFSILMQQKHSRALSIYHTKDPNLDEWWWRRFQDNFVDIGAFGRWYYFDKMFKDYDVNDDEELVLNPPFILYESQS